MVLVNESEWIFRKLDWFHLILNFRLCRSFGFSWQAVWSRMPSMPLIEMSSEEEPLSCLKDQPWWVLPAVSSRWSMKTIENPWFWSMVRLCEDFVQLLDVFQLTFHAPLPPRTNEEFWSWIFVWQRFSFQQLLTWERNTCTQPRMLAATTNQITQKLVTWMFLSRCGFYIQFNSL